MSATLGGLIKDYRLQKNIPQLEIAYKIGWKDATILSRIEKGVTKQPSREIIDKLCDAMHLDNTEKSNILLAGCYVPTKEEVESIRTITTPIINQYRYPIIVEDFTWRVVHENKAGEHLEYRDQEEVDKADITIPSALEYNFDDLYMADKFPASIEKDKKEFLISITAQFISEHKNRSNQKWYKDTLKRLMAKPTFREIYQEALKYDENELILDYTKQTVAHRRNQDCLLSFYMFTVPILSDVRFFLEFHIPANKETYLYYETHSY